MTMVLAEKTVTALQRSTANTRWRDFGDIYQLTGRNSYTKVMARGALIEVARYRGVELTLLRPRWRVSLTSARPAISGGETA